MTPATQYATVGLVIFAYLFGSIPFGLVLTRLFTSVDIRREGSGNIGATNVRRLAGTPLGILTLAGDVSKGALPVYLSQMVTASTIIPQEVYVSIVALAAFLGHLYPLYLKLKSGGKGVATAAGGLAAILGVVALVLFLSAQLYAMGRLLGQLTGLAPWAAIVLSAVTVVLYTWRGGNWAVHWSDSLQLVWIYAGILMATAAGLQAVGGLEALAQPPPAAGFEALGELFI